jgi:hypothetical protein
VISTVEKKFAKTQAFDWLRRETFQTDHVAHAFKLLEKKILQA